MNQIQNILKNAQINTYCVLQARFKSKTHWVTCFHIKSFNTSIFCKEPLINTLLIIYRRS